jgi:hypothetical protein
MAQQFDPRRTKTGSGILKRLQTLDGSDNRFEATWVWLCKYWPDRAQRVIDNTQLIITSEAFKEASPGDIGLIWMSQVMLETFSLLKAEVDADLMQQWMALQNQARRAGTTYVQR